MKNFLIITNDKKDPQYALTHEISDYIEKKGASAQIAAKSMDGEKGSIIPENTPIDCVLVLGGDGTMLRAAKDIMGCGLNPSEYFIGTFARRKAFWK